MKIWYTLQQYYLLVILNIDQFYFYTYIIYYIYNELRLFIINIAKTEINHYYDFFFEENKAFKN